MKTIVSTSIAAAFIGFAALPSTIHAETVYGLSGGGTGYVNFDTATPGLLSAFVPFIGLSGPTGQIETVLAIDFRPQDPGFLYGYSSLNRLLRIDITTNVANVFTTFPTYVATPANGAGTDIPTAFPPTGTVSSDWNPAADSSRGALRIEDTVGANLRYVPFTDTLNGDDRLTTQNQIVGLAYTNNDTNTATGTSLYVIDRNTNSLYLQNPPNDGLLTLVGAGLGIPPIVSSDVGFDIPLFATGTGAGASTDKAYASIDDIFYRVDVNTGVAMPIGGIGAPGVTEVTDIAIIPEPATGALLLLGFGGYVARARNRRAA